MKRRSTLALLLALTLTGVAPTPPRAPAPALNALDLISLEIVYTTLLARYYKPIAPARLLAGARNGLVAYLYSRGITDPKIPLAAANADRYTAENAIDRDVALAVSRYGSRIRVDDLLAGTITGELAVLNDPYTVLFRPAAYKQFVGFLDGTSRGGIGAELDVDPTTHAVRIVDVFPDTPAAGAGLRAGDIITAIDGTAPASRTPDGVRLALSGAPGSTVHLNITRDGVALATVALVRRPIVPPDVTERTLPNRVAYVRIRTFGAQAAAQFDAAFARAQADRAIAYVFDLRADGGGYRDAAVAIASHFVSGTIVTTAERGAPPQTFTANAHTARLLAPYALLVDGDTASASEIVAGAVQDAHTAPLIGTRTFGKGLVQEVFPMPGGSAIKVTTASYRTPAGRDIEGNGITPDIIVPATADTHIGEPGHDPALDNAIGQFATALPSRP